MQEVWGQLTDVLDGHQNSSNQIQGFSAKGIPWARWGRATRNPTPWAQSLRPGETRYGMSELKGEPKFNWEEARRRRNPTSVRVSKGKSRVDFSYTCPTRAEQDGIPGMYQAQRNPRKQSQGRTEKEPGNRPPIRWPELVPGGARMDGWGWGWRHISVSAPSCSVSF